MIDLEARINDIFLLIDDLTIHKEKFRIVADCLQSFLLYKKFVVAANSVYNETLASRVDFALGELQALLLMLSPTEWIDYICHTKFDHALTVVLAKITEIKEFTNAMFNATPGIFDVPPYKINYADYIDILRISKIIKTIPPQRFGDIKPIDLYTSINSILKNYQNPKCFDYRQIDAYKRFFIQPNELEIIQKVGSGTFSTIFHGRLISTGKEIAVKFFTSAHSRVEHFNQFISEASAYSRLSHQNIVTFYGITSKPPFLLVTEFMDGGNLFRALQTEGAVETPEILDYIALSIAKGLLHLHKLGSTHGDIKSLNILLSKSGNVKLCDFGSSRIYRDPFADRGPIGTVSWSAPEMLRPEGERQISAASDSYSYGVVLLEMLTRRPPESSTTRVIPADASPKLRALIEKCLSPDPINRPSMSEIVNLFEKKVVSFSKPSNMTVSVSSLKYLVENSTKDSYDLLGDICTEIPATCEFVLNHVVNNEISSAVKPSYIRLLRAICRTKELCEKAVSKDIIDVCLKNLEQEDLQVRCLFLLLNIVRLSNHRLTPAELNVLNEYPDSVLVSLVLMYGSDFSLELTDKFIETIETCTDQILPSVLCGFRYFLRNANLNNNEQMVYKIFNSLFSVLQSNEETSASQAVYIFQDIIPTINIKLSLLPQHMILIGKWIFVKNTALHIASVNLLAIIAASENISIAASGQYDFMVILLHSLQLSCVKENLCNAIMKIIQKEEIAKYFVEKQLANILQGEISAAFRPFLFKMMCSVAWTKSEVFNSPGAQRLIRDIIATTEDEKIIRLVCRFLIVSGKSAEFMQTIGSARFIDIIEKTSNIDLAVDILRILMIVGKKGIKIEYKRTALASSKFINDEKAKLMVLYIAVQACNALNDRSWLTPEIISSLKENKDKLKEFSNNIEV